MKYAILILTFSFSSFASSLLFPHEDPLLSLEVERNSQIEAYDILPNPIEKELLNDINNYFKANSFFKDIHTDRYKTAFWYKVYTRLNTHDVFLHNREDVGDVYKLINFSKLHQNIKDVFLAYLLQVHHSELIARSIEPKKLRHWNIRSQTGQKQRFEKGFERAKTYQKDFPRLASLFELPIEILAFPFLESLFNPTAKSKVGAAGLWQLMPEVGLQYLPKSTDRFNPHLSTIAGFHLLKENFRLLKDWPLTILSYNSGAYHIRRYQKRHKNLSLKNLFEKASENRHFGFATQNFYYSFSALNFYLQKTNLWQKNQTGSSFFVDICKNKILFSSSLQESSCLKKVDDTLTRRRYPKNWFKVLSKRKRKAEA
jgi:hypothetical protein